ncbi:ANTAR domain-containing response regulator [Qiania dongpingensis]|uniref:ANTAR domain-containing protein n=1 Tax=Qiania dongpingensis TaxID=2763669 RepID=A0A7G9G7P8_9FIRM|nr:ANTAR domain-containing protein [Qiania dongpingensis]QNM06830.1 ANTAR domain-containing protein [Qiania dongpingensis]
MANIIVVFPKAEDAKNVRNILTRNGFNVTAVCTTGAQVLNYADSLDDGVVVCGYRFADMRYAELHDYLPDGFQMLLVASQQYWGECTADNLVCVSMPLRLHDLIDTLAMMEEALVRRRRKLKERPRQRSAEDKEAILKAKEVLMERNNMTETEAHRYIQKCSMDSGTNMAETAQMILSIMKQ